MDKEKNNSMIYEIINTFFAILITLLSGWFAWQSTLLVHEKNERKRKRNGREWGLLIMDGGNALHR